MKGLFLSDGLFWGWEACNHRWHVTYECDYLNNRCVWGFEASQSHCGGHCRWCRRCRWVAVQAGGWQYKVVGVESTGATCHSHPQVKTSVGHQVPCPLASWWSSCGSARLVGAHLQHLACTLPRQPTCIVISGPIPIGIEPSKKWCARGGIPNT